VGPRAGLDGCGKSRPPPGFDPQTVQPVASRYSDWAIPALQKQSTFPKLRNIPTALSVFRVQGKCYFILHTPWSSVLEKLTGSQLVKKFPAFYGTAFTGARHLFLS